jgi:hypothetical protein
MNGRTTNLESIAAKLFSAEIVHVAFLALFFLSFPIEGAVAQGLCSDSHAKAMAQGRVGERPDLAEVIDVYGNVSIQDCNGSRALQRGDLVEIDNCIVTGTGGMARLLFAENYDRRGERTGILTISSTSQACFSNFRSLPRKSETLVELLRGGIRWFTNGWGASSIFSAKAGTTITGFRGTDGLVFYDPQQQRVVSALVTGRATVGSGDRSIDLKPSEAVTVLNGSLQERQQMTGQVREQLLSKFRVPTPF